MYFATATIITAIFAVLFIRTETIGQKIEKYPKSSNPLNNLQKFYSTVLPAKISIPSAPLNYCSYFNNRAPSPQINLKNCTWYNENSCCLQSEIESTFSKVS